MLWPVLLLFLGAGPQPSPAPVESELAAAARREAERRARVPGRGRHSYADEDLRRDQPAATPASPAPATPPAVSHAAPQRGGDDLPPKEGRSEDPAPPGPAAAGADTSGQDDVPDRGQWLRWAEAARAKLATATQQVDANRAKQDGVREKLNPMSPSFTTDTNQQLQAQSELSELQREEQSLRQAVAEAQAGLADLRESARRRGVPARVLEPAPER